MLEFHEFFSINITIISEFWMNYTYKKNIFLLHKFDQILIIIII